MQTQAMCNPDGFNNIAKDVWHWLLVAREYGKTNKDGLEVDWVHLQWITPSGDVYLVKFVAAELVRMERLPQFNL